MKIVALLVALGAGGLLLHREMNKPKLVSPIAPPSYVPSTAAPALTVAEAPATAATALRRPIVQTQNALQAVKARNGDGEY